MKLTLRIWRQADPASKGSMHTYRLDDVSPDMSFLEMLDVLNEQLNADGEEPVAFDSDCREGICGMCGLMINGQAHGPTRTTTCQLHMRSFADGDTITIEPWRATAFPVLKDLCVDRRAFDRIIAGRRLHLGEHRRRPGRARHAGAQGATPTGPSTRPPASAAAPASPPAPTPRPSLFLGAKITHLGELPQGQAERDSRVVQMAAQHDAEGFGGCTNIGECAAACPKEIPHRRDLPAQLGPARRHAARPLTAGHHLGCRLKLAHDPYLRSQLDLVLIAGGSLRDLESLIVDRRGEDEAAPAVEDRL